MDSSSKYFVVTILALFLLEVEFTCVETRDEEVRALVFDEGWNPCTFAVAFERDRTFLEETLGMLTSEDAKKGRRRKRVRDTDRKIVGVARAADERG